MPFTLCHPAIVVPLARRAPRATLLPALVIGSMAPDFAYFVPLAANGGFSHSWRGLLLYCVPAGLVVYAVYYALLRQAFLAWAPQAVAARMAPAVGWAPRDARSAAILVASLWIGAASHILWDGLTHANSGVVQQVALLHAPVAIAGAHVPVYKLLQHISTLIGFLVLAGYVAGWYRRTAPAPGAGRRPSHAQRLLALGGILLGLVTGGLLGLLHPSRTIEHALFWIVVRGMDGASIAILLLAAVWRMMSRRA